MISEARKAYIAYEVNKYGVERVAAHEKLPIETIKDYVYRYQKQVRDSGTPAKVLLFDIETTPMEVYTWGLWKQNIHIGQIIKDWNIICWRGKWLFGDEIIGDVQTSEEAVNRDDERVSKSLWKAINEADIIIAHNLLDFDLKKANSRFLKHGLLPPSSSQLIDTLKVARQQFKMASNKLDYLCSMLGIEAKLDTGFELWKKCLAGDKNALKEMYDYCGQDTSILEDLYLKLRPWVKSHPNIALYLEDRDNACSNCGSHNLHEDSKPYYTPTGKYQAFRCFDCGAIIRSRHSVKRTPDLLRSVGR